MCLIYSVLLSGYLRPWGIPERKYLGKCNFYCVTNGKILPGIKTVLKFGMELNRFVVFESLS